MLKTALPAVAAFLLSMAVGAAFAALRAGGGEVDLGAAIAENLASDSTQVDAAPEEQADEVENGASGGDEAVEERVQRADSAAAPAQPAPARNETATQPGNGASMDNGGAAADAETADASGSPADGSGPAIVTATLPPPTPADSARQAQLGRIFAAMQPRDAARVLEQMDDADIVRIITMLRERQAAAVLSNLPPERAAAISRSKLAGGSQP